MLVSFWIPFLIHFPSNPCFICQFPCFFLRIISLPSATVWYRMHGARMRGVGRDVVAWVVYRRSWSCTQNYAGARFNVPTQGLIPGPSLAPFPAGNLVVELCRSFVIIISQTQLQFGHLTIPELAKWVCPFLLPMSGLKFASTTRDSLPSIPSTERTKGEKHSCWFWQFLPCLSLLIVYHQARNATIGSYFYGSVSASPSLASMMASTCWLSKPRIMASPRISLSLSLPWRISLFDLVRPWCIRISEHNYDEVKAHRSR